MARLGMGASEGERSKSGVTQQQQFESVKLLSPYYRETLAVFSLPGIELLPPDLVQKIDDINTVEFAQMQAQLAALPNFGLSAAKDRALRLMMLIIVASNRVLQPHNPHDVPADALFIGELKGLMNEVLTFDPCLAYLENTAALLLRLNKIDEMVVFIAENSKFFQDSLRIDAIMGFMLVIEGAHERGLALLKPLADSPASAQLGLIKLGIMTAQFHLGIMPDGDVQFDSLDAALPMEYIQKFPPMQWLKHCTPDDKPILFVACDDAYFYEHVLPLAYSLKATNADALALHMHFYSPSAEVLAEWEKMAMRQPGINWGTSYEIMPEMPEGQRPVYYASMRFVRAHALLEEYERPICLSDADALLHGNWAEFSRTYEIDATTSLALVHSPSSPFWETIAAGFLYVAPSPTGRDYLGRVAAFIAHNLALGCDRWFLDQIALSAVYERFYGKTDAQDIRKLPISRTLDLTHRASSLLWVVTNYKSAYARYNAYREELATQYGAGRA